MRLTLRLFAIRVLPAVLCVLLAQSTATAAQPASAVSFPFKYLNHEVVVDVRVGSSGPYHFLLDTDTSPSGIDLALARRLRLPLSRPAGNGSGIGSGTLTAIPLVIPRMSVGGLPVTNLDALAFDLSKLSAQFGGRIAGVLGTSFFNHRVVQIDYPCRRVSILPDALLQPYTARFFSDENGIGTGEDLSSDVCVNGRRIVATFDTGDSGESFVTA